MFHQGFSRRCRAAWMLRCAMTHQLVGVIAGEGTDVEQDAQKTCAAQPAPGLPPACSEAIRVHIVGFG